MAQTINDLYNYIGILVNYKGFVYIATLLATKLCLYNDTECLHNDTHSIWLKITFLKIYQIIFMSLKALV